jgi:hypothetical protein
MPIDEIAQHLGISASYVQKMGNTPSSTR